MPSAKSKKDERIGWMISLGIHGALLLLFFFIMAWKEPNPPHPEYGIELNLGLEEAGSGTFQPTVPVRPQTNQQPTETEVKESAAPEADPTPTQPVEQESKPTTSQTESTITQEEESPIVAKKETTTPKPIEKTKTEKVPDPKPEPPKESKAQEVKEVTKPASGKDAYPQPGATPSQGDTQGASSDQGSKTGSVDSRALYGPQGGGDGPSLDIAGWTWNSIPKPNDPSQESGRIVYQITLDDRGDVIGIKTIESTVSPGIERIYREAVQKLSFSPTSDNRRPAPQTTGKVTFIIKKQ